MTITHVAGYKFTTLKNLAELQNQFHQECVALNLLGTILLSPEGINIALSGENKNIQLFQSFLKKYHDFSNMQFNESQCSIQPFKRLKVKIKKEIITFRQDNISPDTNPAAHIEPQEFKQWLDEKRDITILDTRNEYEIRFGTFKNAINPGTQHFSEFVNTSEKLKKDKPVVMMCTGGIRCEKAAIYLRDNGFQEVYQLQNGLLNYFKETGGAHFEGECFVFDERVTVDVNLQETQTKQCKICQYPITSDSPHTCYILNIT
jgi:UPF0176 protein